MYQLAQSSARSDQWGIPAKGVTGSGYEGHYFWDTEIYVVPFLTFTSPTWARNALRFRSNLLPKARERARELNQRGALFPRSEERRVGRGPRLPSAPTTIGHA